MVTLSDLEGLIAERNTYKALLGEAQEELKRYREAFDGFFPGRNMAQITVSVDPMERSLHNVLSFWSPVVRWAVPDDVMQLARFPAEALRTHLDTACRKFAEGVRDGVLEAAGKAYAPHL